MGNEEKNKAEEKEQNKDCMVEYGTSKANIVPTEQKIYFWWAKEQTKANIVTTEQNKAISELWNKTRHLVGEAHNIKSRLSV